MRTILTYDNRERYLGKEIFRVNDPDSPHHNMICRKISGVDNSEVIGYHFNPDYTTVHNINSDTATFCGVKEKCLFPVSPMLSKAELAIGIPNLDDIRNIYTYGSVAYGTNNEKSDEDYIIVCNNGSLGFPKSEFYGGNTNITAYEVDAFQGAIDAHEISVLECLFLPDHLKTEELQFVFFLDKGKLRDSVSAKCSNSFVKCKKKLIVPESYDPYIGKKSLFHALRMANFGTQIAVHGKIKLYTSMNEYFNDIMYMPDDWEKIKAKYQPIYNSYMTRFREVSPKNI